MKLAIGMLGVALALGCSAQNVATTTETQTEKKATAVPEAAPNTYRVTYTLTELDGNKQLSVQHFSLTMTTDSRLEEFKIGGRIPINIGSYDADHVLQSSVQYQDVGLNIGARIKEYPTGILFNYKFEQTSVDEASSAEKDRPVIRQATLANTAVLTLGKPVMLGSLDIPHTTRHMDFAVVIEIVR